MGYLPTPLNCGFTATIPFSDGSFDNAIGNATGTSGNITVNFIDVPKEEDIEAGLENAITFILSSTEEIKGLYRFRVGDSHGHAIVHSFDMDGKFLSQVMVVLDTRQFQTSTEIPICFEKIAGSITVNANLSFYDSNTDGHIFSTVEYKENSNGMFLTDDYTIMMLEGVGIFFQEIFDDYPGYYEKGYTLAVFTNLYHFGNYDTSGTTFKYKHYSISPSGITIIEYKIEEL